ncbi:hypothetical protein Tsubulata_051591 [Turnera subulata]|uniref:Protein phosphatase n=1 Tax=Turnera subulata TaxID=218843 RepID=A0A9Q0FJ84_9ROSI|nr:hypothetical protein Tsubulata_051591 [Turnera subulata]
MARVDMEKGKLTLLSGSCYLPKERDSKPQGDDAHFICIDKQTIGLADGVGGYSNKGIDAGVYARELIMNAENATKNLQMDQLTPIRVLTEAYGRTKARGASTACIITLDNNNRLLAANVGDCRFMVIRNGAHIFKSPIQQRGFNCPFQLGNEGSNNKPGDAEVFIISVEAGDVIVAGTDGVFDNLFETQIEELVWGGIQQGLDPEEIAWSVAQQAYFVSMDRQALTPFMNASRNAQRNHSGGKQDDITVIISCVIGS